MNKKKNRHKMQTYVVHETVTTRYIHHVEATSKEEAENIVSEGDEDTCVDDHDIGDHKIEAVRILEEE